MKFVFSAALRFSFMNPDSKRMAQKDFVFYTYTKPRQLTHKSVELKSWSRRKVTADSSKNETIKE